MLLGHHDSTACSGLNRPMEVLSCQVLIGQSLQELLVPLGFSVVSIGKGFCHLVAIPIHGAG